MIDAEIYIKTNSDLQWNGENYKKGEVIAHFQNAKAAIFSSKQDKEASSGITRYLADSKIKPNYISIDTNGVKHMTLLFLGAKFINKKQLVTVSEKIASKLPSGGSLFLRQKAKQIINIVDLNSNKRIDPSKYSYNVNNNSLEGYPFYGLYQVFYEIEKETKFITNFENTISTYFDIEVHSKNHLGKIQKSIFIPKTLFSTSPTLAFENNPDVGFSLNFQILDSEIEVVEYGD